MQKKLALSIELKLMIIITKADTSVDNVLYLSYFSLGTPLIFLRTGFDQLFNSDAGDGTILNNISTSWSFCWIKMVWNAEALLPDFVHDLGVELALDV